jgi:hypothetical protein
MEIRSGHGWRHKFSVREVLGVLMATSAPSFLPIAWAAIFLGGIRLGGEGDGDAIRSDAGRGLPRTHIAGTGDIAHP